MIRCSSNSSDDDDDELDHNDAASNNNDIEMMNGHSRPATFCHERVASQRPSRHTEHQKKPAFAVSRTSKRVDYSITPEPTISKPSAYDSSSTLPDSLHNAFSLHTQVSLLESDQPADLDSSYSSTANSRVYQNQRRLNLNMATLQNDDDDGNAIDHIMKDIPNFSSQEANPLTKILDDTGAVMELIVLDPPDSDNVSIAAEFSRRMSLATFENNRSASRIAVDQELSTDDTSANMMDDDDMTEVIDNRVRPFSDGHGTDMDLVGIIIGLSTGTNVQK
jgi:hypothetical protein